MQLGAINSAVDKDANAISFPVEIHRDGPGHLAIVDLPYGVEAADVFARRGRLASGLRLPLDQVWPEPAPGHTGRLALWVGHEPASQMRQPAWPLIRGGTVDMFKPFPFATTPRMDVVEAELLFRNWLFGGQPGSGKTFALRLMVLAAALDPRVELRGYELKGVGDFKQVEPICTEYGNGFDDDTLERCAQMFVWLYEECRRRSKRIEHYAGLGKAPENKVTPELASLKGSGLHPLVVFVDEIQELFQSKFGKEAAELAGEGHQAGSGAGRHPADRDPDPGQGQPAAGDHPQREHAVLPVGGRPDRERHDPGDVGLQERLPGDGVRAGHRGRVGASCPASASRAPDGRSTSTTRTPRRSSPAPSPRGSRPARCPTPVRRPDSRTRRTTCWPMWPRCGRPARTRCGTRR